MISTGICITKREFTCLLCNRKFIRETADSILLEYTLCDECFTELLDLEEPILSQRISGKLKGKSDLDDTVVNAVAKVIQAKKTKP